MSEPNVVMIVITFEWTVSIGWWLMMIDDDDDDDDDNDDYGGGGKNDDDYYSRPLSLPFAFACPLLEICSTKEMKWR